MKQRVLYPMILSGIGTLAFGSTGVASVIGILPGGLAFPAMLLAGLCVLALAIAIVVYANNHPAPPPTRHRNDMFANTYKWNIE